MQKPSINKHEVAQRQVKFHYSQINTWRLRMESNKSAGAALNSHRVVWFAEIICEASQTLQVV